MTPARWSAGAMRLAAAGLAAAALAAAVLAAGCGNKPPAAAAATDKPGPSGEIPDHCGTADDCDLVEACCGCNAGGKKIAIRKDAVASYMASREQRCGGVMCAQFISHDPTCDAEAICGSRDRCRVAPHMQHQ